MPLLRDQPMPGLRLHRELSEVDSECQYLPHAFVLSTTAAYGTQLGAGQPTGMEVRSRRRRPRFLPLPVAAEGYLTLQSGRPPIAWREWTTATVGRGLSPRADAAYRGTAIAGLEDALRVFELHPRQCGVALYLADALAGVFVTPHPDDYRLLHPTLLQDMYGEPLFQYAHLFPPVQDFTPRLEATKVSTVDDLRAEVARARDEWSRFHDLMAGGLLQGRVVPHRVRVLGPYTLARLVPPYALDVDNHVGEAITDAEGRIAYLTTLRLSAAQTRRGHLLSTLYAHDWNLDETAAALGTDRAGVAQRLERAGFAHLLRPGS
ncbi:hypothetical protein KZZ52_21040 [Dactylosporangium sp. AC04546]|uniref:ARPP-2 domain-containing protein n=1 Tax=Dactylosporangium sp. AC04546 TaxID=2862460 RepID=UPI001EE08FBF|nr:hypothetical protein [Dactylosporangium sp. AC04546]WVK87773.1 hypothetical protein KZZ52_21040 [Dactylosporangium sp. AC04546]